MARPGTPGHLEVILKIEPAEYRDVLILEKLCLDLHGRMGMNVPRRWLRDIDGMRILAVERFDRAEGGKVLPQETLRSVIATGDRRFFTNEDVSMDELPARLERLGEACNLNVTATKKEMYRRYLVAMLTGNGDMHLENLSFLGGAGETRLSPIYDPAPMRAWPQHDTRSAIPVDFLEGETWPKALRRLGLAYAYTPGEWRGLVEETLEQTASYLDEVADLPIEGVRKQRLTDIVLGIRGELGVGR
jgi:serine/threonine-protein kinase HipA